MVDTAVPVITDKTGNRHRAQGVTPWPDTHSNKVSARYAGRLNLQIKNGHPTATGSSTLLRRDHAPGSTPTFASAGSVT